jgi:hypothetical protein
MAQFVLGRDPIAHRSARSWRTSSGSRISLTTRRRAPSASYSSSTDRPQPQLRGGVGSSPRHHRHHHDGSGRSSGRAHDHDVAQYGSSNAAARRLRHSAAMRRTLGQLARDAQRDDDLLDPPQEPTRF